MSNETVSFLSDFFGDLFEPIVPYPKQGMRILHKVRNGKSFLWYCPVTETYWKTLKACRALHLTHNVLRTLDVKVQHNDI